MLWTTHFTCFDFKILIFVEIILLCKWNYFEITKLFHLKLKLRSILKFTQICCANLLLNLKIGWALLRSAYTRVRTYVRGLRPLVWRARFGHVRDRRPSASSCAVGKASPFLGPQEVACGHLLRRTKKAFRSSGFFLERFWRNHHLAEPDDFSKSSWVYKYNFRPEASYRRPLARPEVTPFRGHCRARASEMACRPFPRIGYALDKAWFANFRGKFAGLVSDLSR